MINENKIIFGYGDLGVFNSRKQLIIREIKLPLKVGTHVIDRTKFSMLDDETKQKILNDMDKNPELFKFVEYNKNVQDVVIRFISINDIEDFVCKLNDIIQLKTVKFNFHGYEFDFSSKNIESVGVVFRHIRQISKIYGYELGYSVQEHKFKLTRI